MLRHADGREETFSAAWLVGCDGAHSAVRHGARRRPSTARRWTATGCWPTSTCAAIHAPTPRPRLYWHRDGVLVLFPISPGRYRIIADLPPSGGRAPAGADAGAKSRRSSTGAAPPGIVVVRPDLARRVPDQRAQGRRIPPGPRLPGRRRRAHPQPGRRAGHEHRHAGRLQPGLEARPGRPRGLRRAAARQLRPGAQRGRRPGAQGRRPVDGAGDAEKPRRPERAQPGRSRDAGARPGTAGVRGHA